MTLTLVRETREVWNPYDEGPVGTEEVFVVRNGDDTYEFPTAAAAHRALDALDEANRAGRATFPCSWTVELTGSRRPYEVDFPSDLYGPCEAPAAEDADGAGWACLAGHGHRSDAEYYEADEVASLRERGLPLAENARLMDGTEVW